MMALQGNLEDFEITDVFQLIQLGQKDGGLRINSNDDAGVVYFKNGMVIHAQTNSLKGQTAIDAILSWAKGRFVFNPNEEAHEKTVDLPIQQVILDAARRIDELAKIQKLIPSFNTVVKIIEVPKPGVEKINLRPEEWKVLSFVDGARNIKEIAANATLTEFETARILYGLISSGLIEIVPQLKAGPSPMSEGKQKESKEEKKEGGGFLGFFRKK